MSEFSKKVSPNNYLDKSLESIVFCNYMYYTVVGGKRWSHLAPYPRCGSQTDGRPLGWWPASP